MQNFGYFAGPVGGAEIVHRSVFFLPDRYPISPFVNIPSVLGKITPIFSSHFVPTELTSILLLELGT